MAGTGRGHLSFLALVVVRNEREVEVRSVHLPKIAKVGPPRYFPVPERFTGAGLIPPIESTK